MNEKRRELSHDQVGMVRSLKSSNSDNIKIDADTEVLCVHRGRNLTQGGRLVREEGYPRRPVTDEERQPGIVYVGDYTDMWDSRQYIIPPGYFYCKFGAAKHFQDRAVVPGSRNPETRSQASFVSVIGVVQATTTGFEVLKAVDDADQWPPFTEDEVAEYEIAVEALDRGAMVDAIAPEVHAVPLAGGHLAGEQTSRVKGRGGPSQRRTRIEGVQGGEQALKKGQADSGRLGEAMSSERSAAITAGGVEL